MTELQADDPLQSTVTQKAGKRERQEASGLHCQSLWLYKSLLSVEGKFFGTISRRLTKFLLRNYIDITSTVPHKLVEH